MLASRVADHYRAKGYQVQPHVKVRGTSGTIHAVDLMVKGPLGALAVFTGDAGGIEGPEIPALQRAAKDMGATPVIAAARIDSAVRGLAERAGIVVLDDEALQEEPRAEPQPAWPKGPERTKEPEEHPWPATARARPHDEGKMVRVEVDQLLEAWSQDEEETEEDATGLWKFPRGRKEPETKSLDTPAGPFGWLRPKEPPLTKPETFEREAPSRQAPTATSPPGKTNGNPPGATTRNTEAVLPPAPRTRAQDEAVSQQASLLARLRLSREEVTLVLLYSGATALLLFFLILWFAL